MTETDAVPLSDSTRELLDGKNFATVATLNADGAPQASVVCVKRDEDIVLFSTTTGRRKARNLARDPPVALENPYQSVEIERVPL
jgi:PPOX class probable F420-dependent enzyme